jgi:predicted DNA-binding ribbon-helix-helix protein
LIVARQQCPPRGAGHEISANQILGEAHGLDGAHLTSVSLEEAFLEALREIAKERGTSLQGLVTSIDRDRREGRNLSSALRVYVLDHFRDQIAARTPSA